MSHQGHDSLAASAPCPDPARLFEKLLEKLVTGIGWARLVAAGFSSFLHLLCHVL